MSRISRYIRVTAPAEAVAIRQAERRKCVLPGRRNRRTGFQTRAAATAAIDIMQTGIGRRDNQSNGSVEIGATTVLQRHGAPSEHCRLASGAFVEAIRETAPWLIRNSATLAGNICNASPSADSAPCCSRSTPSPRSATAGCCRLTSSSPDPTNGR